MRWFLKEPGQLSSYFAFNFIELDLKEYYIRIERELKSLINYQLTFLSWIDRIIWSI
jgi:hypothetical protein